MVMQQPAAVYNFVISIRLLKLYSSKLQSEVSPCYALKIRAPPNLVHDMLKKTKTKAPFDPCNARTAKRTSLLRPKI